MGNNSKFINRSLDAHPIVSQDRQIYKHKENSIKIVSSHLK